MPPKPRRKLLAKPGVCRQLMERYFLKMPDNPAELLKGHVYSKLYFTKSKIQTVRAVREKNYNVAVTVDIKHILSLERSLKSYLPKLSKEKSRTRFMDICNKRFFGDGDILQQQQQRDDGQSVMEQPSIHAGIKHGPAAEPTPNAPVDCEQPGTSSCVIEAGTVLCEQPSLKQNPSAPQQPASQDEGCQTFISPAPPATMSSMRSLKRRGLLTPLKRSILTREDGMKQEIYSLKRDNAILKSTLASTKYKQNRYLRRQVERLTHRLESRNKLVKAKDQKLREIRKEVVEAEMIKELENAKRTVRRLKHMCKDRPTKATFQRVSRQNTDLRKKLKEKEGSEFMMQDKMLQLEDELLELSQHDVDCREDAKSVGYRARMLVAYMVDSGVPTEKVPQLIQRVGCWFGVKVENIPQRKTVERIARELGVVSDLLTAELALKSPNSTLGFDATTQDGVHVNEVHLTTAQKESKVIALDELPGGTALDYESHITRSVRQLANVHSHVHGSNPDDVEQQIRGNVKNSMSDRCPVNNATIKLVEDKWDTNITQLNCNLHPLESITRECKKVLKEHESNGNLPSGRCFGSDCLAGNVILKSTQLRYKDSTGDPRQFKANLRKADLPCNLLPRFRGSRLHVTHKIAEVLLQHEQFFSSLFANKHITSAQLRAALQADFDRDDVRIELQVLGVIGKTVTGPWMKLFYDDEQSDMSHFEAFSLIEKSIGVVKTWGEDVESALTSKVDCFGGYMVLDECLLKLPENTELFKSMLADCFHKIVEVLSRQYKNYFTLDVDEKLRKETESARVHNIYAEQLMGMFSAIKGLKSNASVDFISCCIRSRKNQVVDYLLQLEDEERETVMLKARTFARKSQARKRKAQKEMEKEITRRFELKMQKGIDADHKRLVNSLKNGKKKTSDFPEHKEGMDMIMEGRLNGEMIAHTFVDTQENKPVMYLGRVESFDHKKKKYVVAYWKPHEGETYESDAVDEDETVYNLAVDYYLGDLILEQIVI